MNDMAVDYERRPITVEDYHRMADAGIFEPDERVELLDGELIAVPPMGSPHAGAVGEIARLFNKHFGDRMMVRMGLPVIVDDRSEPEPDLAVVPVRNWSDRHPAPNDVLLLVEVAHSSRDFDLRRKAPTYGRAGIRELWIVDIAERRLVVHRQPGPRGYGLVRVLYPGEQVAALAFPEVTFDVVALTGL